jgi:hypothetical protein
MFALAAKTLWCGFFIAAFYIFRNNKAVRYPLTLNFIFKSAIWFVLYLCLQLPHTADLVQYKKFSELSSFGFIPNRDFPFPYGPLFITLFQAVDIGHEFIGWYFLLAVCDTAILGLLMKMNLKFRDSTFWFWLFNPLNLLLTAVLGQNQILMILFAVVAMYFIEKNFKVSLISISVGAILIKLLILIYIPGILLLLLKNRSRFFQISVFPVAIYSVVGFHITSKWYAGLGNELDLITPGNFSFWLINYLPHFELQTGVILSFALVSLVWIVIGKYRAGIATSLPLATISTSALFLISNPRSYSEYWIFLLAPICLLQDEGIRVKMMHYFAIISLLAPLEMTYYFNIIRHEVRQGSTIDVLFLALFDLVIIFLGILIVSQIFRKAKSSTMILDVDSGT